LVFREIRNIFFPKRKEVNKISLFSTDTFFVFYQVYLWLYARRKYSFIHLAKKVLFYPKVGIKLVFFVKKVYITPSTIKDGLLHSLIYKPDFLPPKLSKTSQIIPPNSFATVIVILSFYFYLFIFYESLKNYRKMKKINFVLTPHE
jgi:hypothetical protein